MIKPDEGLLSAIIREKAKEMLITIIYVLRVVGILTV